MSQQTSAMVFVDGVLRPQCRADGLPIHPLQEGVENFWRWFGDSDVVDEAGRPLVLYHGGFSDFDRFDPGMSCTGVFSFSAETFAHEYAQTKSMDQAADFDVLVRPFYLSAKLFRADNAAHIARLEAVLPESLSICGRYGWAAIGGSIDYSRRELLEVIQGIRTPYTPINDKVIAEIVAGKTRVQIDGGSCVILSYDKDKGQVEYVDSYIDDGLNAARHQLAQAQSDGSAYRINVATNELKKREAMVKPRCDLLHPPKEQHFDTWVELESPELRPYLQAAGFTGAMMQERRRSTICVFDPTQVKAVFGNCGRFDPQDPDLFDHRAAPQMRGGLDDALLDDAVEAAAMCIDILNRQDGYQSIVHDYLSEALACERSPDPGIAYRGKVEVAQCVARAAMDLTKHSDDMGDKQLGWVSVHRDLTDRLAMYFPEAARAQMQIASGALSSIETVAKRDATSASTNIMGTL